jgi:branched-chain amino acid transport system ATP-binding protein
MIPLLGASPAVFIGVTMILFGLGAFLTGQAIAEQWRPAGRVVMACLGLAIADRLFTVALFEGPLLSAPGLVVSTSYLVAVGLLGWRLTQVRKMVTQYPWLYERAGLFSWRSKGEV